MSKDDLTQVELEDITENNRYLTREPFDVSSILVDGDIPEFGQDADIMMCVLDVALFIKRNGINNHTNLAKYLESLEANHRVFFIKHISLEQTEILFSNKAYVNIVREIMKIVV